MDKVHPITGHLGPEGEQMYSYTLSLTSVLDGGGWSTPHPGRFTPGNDPVPIVQEAGWAPGPVWTGAENVALTGILSPDRPAHSELLYRLSYRGPLEVCGLTSRLGRFTLGRKSRATHWNGGEMRRTKVFYPRWEQNSSSSVEYLVV
jgi:hypothetical protein